MEEPTIKRKNPSKKWKDNELLEILNFIVIDPNNFEKPTAQIYYRNMLKEVRISATWEIVKWKMRYLKQKYNRALEWQKSAAAELEEQEFQDKILDVCPHFDLLSQIFSPDQDCDFFESSKLSFSENSNSNSQTFIKTETIEPSMYEITTYDKNVASTTNSDDYSPSLLSENLSSPTTSITNQVIHSSNIPVSPKQIVSTSTTSPAANHKKHTSTPKTSVKISHPRSVISSGVSTAGTNDSGLSQSESMKYLETNLDLERRKVDIEEYKIKRQLDLEEKKIQQNFQLRKLEIEKDERVAKYEIEMRYKHKHSNMDMN